MAVSAKVEFVFRNYDCMLSQKEHIPLLVRKNVAIVHVIFLFGEVP